MALYRRNCSVTRAPVDPVTRIVDMRPADIDAREPRGHDQPMGRRWGWLLASVLLLASGCSTTGSAVPSGTTRSVPSGTTGSAVSSGTSVPAVSSSVAPVDLAGTPSDTRVESPPAGAGVLVEFVRQGGISGLSDRLTIHQDGSLTVVRIHPAVSNSGQLTAADLTAVRELLQAPALAQLPKVEHVNGNDLYSYQVRYGDVDIATQDGAVPDALQPLIANLAGIVAKYGS